jgi:hypothetical protein
MNGTVKEQRLRTKKVNAKKVNTPKTQAGIDLAKTYRHNLVTSFTCMRPCLQFVIVKNGAVH